MNLLFNVSKSRKNIKIAPKKIFCIKLKCESNLLETIEILKTLMAYLICYIEEYNSFTFCIN